MSFLAATAGAAWVTAGLAEHARFRRALRDPERAQTALLERYLRDSAGTAWARKIGIDRVRTPNDFRERVPLAGYDDLEPWIDRIARGEAGVLTSEKVIRLVPSSGSTGPAKRIPFTRSLQAELRRAIAPWIVDLARGRRGLFSGTSYWSVSPLASFHEDRDSAVPVGFDDDAEYLGPVSRRLVDAMLAVPSTVRLVEDVTAFRYATLLFLLHSGDLRLMSVWHPSFLGLLLDALPTFWDRLLEDVRRGTLSPPAAVDGATARSLAARLRADPARASALSKLDPREVTRIWPRLRLVSAWGDAHAALALADLRTRLEGVEIQPKGLLATEGFVTIPFAEKHPLAIRSHFFEFLADDRSYLAHEIEEGRTYSVALTTAGGLRRYRLEDRVEVDGFVGRTPSLRFLGKEDHVSDLRGEKLSEGFVASVVAELVSETGVPRRFALLAPDATEAVPRYVLFLETDAELPSALEALLDERLSANPHYRHALALGQLAPALVRRVAAGAQDRYLQACLARGTRLGDVKSLALSPRTDWAELLETPG